MRAASHRRTVTLVTLVSMIVACSTPTVSKSGRQVSLLESDPGSACVAVGDVSGSADPFFGALKSSEQLVDAARNEAREHAAGLGATHVRFDGTVQRWPSGTFGGGQGVTVSGVAYRCGGSDVGSAGALVGCAKDVDCKGDRICEAGRCVAPQHAPAR